VVAIVGPVHQTGDEDVGFAAKRDAVRAASSGRPHLLVSEEGEVEPRAVVYLDEGGRQRVVAGRAATCDLSLPDDERISRVHAVIEVIGGVWTVADEGLSRNGTFLNGERVRRRRVLRTGDVLLLGRTRLRVGGVAGSGSRTTAAATGPRPSLTPAERRVLASLCRSDPERHGAPPSNEAIARELTLEVDTIKFHLRSLYTKFGLRDVPQSEKRAHLRALAIELGYADPSG
jgi:predicted component of type VI protein secretion system